MTESLAAIVSLTGDLIAGSLIARALGAESLSADLAQSLAAGAAGRGALAFRIDPLGGAGARYFTLGCALTAALAGCTEGARTVAIRSPERLSAIGPFALGWPARGSAMGPETLGPAAKSLGP